MSAFWEGLSQSFNDWTSGKYGLSPWDMVLPGSTAISQALDLKGTQAAQTQYNNQLALNQQTQAFNSSEAERQRAWEEMMSSTAFQRQVKDIEDAGFNPYVLYGNSGSFGGASTPSGSSASSSSGSADMANNKLAAAAGAFAIFLRMFLTKGK